MENLATVLKSGQATVVDVRTREEYAGGHVAGSINIPLSELPGRMDELRAMKNLVLCCASGGRSGQAAQFLKTNGVACTNGGSWMDVNYYCNN
jgi:rhodanese-related sulfurtransferase